MRMRRTSAGVVRMRIDMSMALIATDLPEPVVPPMSRCGMVARSASTGAPATSLPMASRSGPPSPAGASTSPSVTELRRTFGTSMPTSDLPGIGARMRTVEAASESARSSASAVTLERRTPLAISTSNRVTVGPATHATTRAGMSKVASVSAIACAMARSSVSEALFLVAVWLVRASSVMVGRTKPSSARGETALAIGTVFWATSGSA